MDVTTVAAIAFSLVAGCVVVFQFALALGAPWGSYAMGGRFPGRFPPAMRIAAVLQALLMGFMAAVVLSRTGLIFPRWSQSSVSLAWVVVAVSAVSVILNAITPSPGERRIWLPVALAMLTSSLTVAMSAG